MKYLNNLNQGRMHAAKGGIFAKQLMYFLFCLILAFPLLEVYATETSTDNNGRMVYFLDNNLANTKDSLNYQYYKVCYFTEGKPYGYVNFYYRSGRFYFQTLVKSLDPDVYIDGKIKFLAESGDTLKILTYQDGALNGAASFYYPKGQLQKQGEFCNNISSGIWKLCDADGKYCIGRYENDLMEGDWTYYNFDGSIRCEGILHANIKDGMWTEYAENGNVTNCHYLNGIPEGIWTCHDRTDNLIFEGTFVKGLKQGLWKERIGNDSLGLGNYLNDQKEGIWTFADSQGLKTSEGTFVKGKQDGVWQTFDTNGNILESNTYQNGERISIPPTLIKIKQ